MSIARNQIKRINTLEEHQQAYSHDEFVSLSQVNTAITASIHKITGFLETSVTLSTSPTKLTLSELSNIGSKLSVSDGGILIGAGVSKVYAQATMRFNTIGSAGNKYCSIYKNSNSACSEPQPLSARGSISITNFPIPVTEGDILFLYVSGVSGDVIAGTAETPTYLTVEVAAV